MIENLVNPFFASFPFFDYPPPPLKHVRVRHDLVRPEFVPKALKVITTHHSYRLNYKGFKLYTISNQSWKIQNFMLIIIYREDPSPII